MTIDQIVGANIKRRRKALKMSQEDLALATGLSASTIYSAESGKKSLSIKNLAKIKEVLRISYSSFFSSTSL